MIARIQTTTSDGQTTRCIHSQLSWSISHLLDLQWGLDVGCILVDISRKLVQVKLLPYLAGHDGCLLRPALSCSGPGAWKRWPRSIASDVDHRRLTPTAEACPSGEVARPTCICMHSRRQTRDGMMQQGRSGVQVVVVVVIQATLCDHAHPLLSIIYCSPTTSFVDSPTMPNHVHAEK